MLVVFGNIPLYGQERANIEVMCAVRDAGYDVLFITNEHWGHLSIEPELQRQGLAWVKAPFGPRLGKSMGWQKWWKACRGIWRTNLIFLREKQQFHPTHLYVTDISNILYAAPAILFDKTPLIYRLGDMPPVNSFLHRMVWLWLKRRLSCLVGNSNFIVSLCRRAGFPTQKLRRIYSCAPTAHEITHDSHRNTIRVRVQSQPQLGKTESELALLRHPNRLHFLYCGQLIESKGVHWVVEIAEKLLSEGAPIQVWIAGDYQHRNPFALDLVQRVQTSGLADSIRFLGFVANTADLFAAANVHLCPSICEEALSNTVLEAKRAGIPSIVFPKGGLPETVQHGVDGWLCSAPTREALEQAVRFYVAHPEATEIQGRAARSTAEPEGKFGKARFRREWAEVFRDVAPGRAREKHEGGLP